MTNQIKIETLDQLVDSSARNHEWRQTETFNLIPSENTPSLFVKLLSQDIPVAKKTEGN